MATYEVPTKQFDRQNTLPSEEYVVKAMPPILRTLDLIAIYVLAILWISNTATAALAGAVSYVYWIIGGLTFFLPCVIATTQLGVMFPHEGSIYNWTHKALGGYWSFLVGLCWWFPGPLVIVAAADTIITYIQGLNPNWLVAPWQQGLAIVAIVILSGVIAVQRFRTVQNMVNIAACLILLAFALIGISGLIWLLKGHPSVTSFSSGSLMNINPTNYSLFGLITLAYLGTQVPLNMGGEIVERKSISRHLLWGTLLVFICYFIATFSLLVVEGPTNATPFALVSVVDTVLGKFAGAITVICIMLFFVMAAVMYNYSFARLLLAGSIDQRLPMSLGKLNKHRVPANSIILQTVIGVVFAALVFLVVPAIGQFGKPADLAVEFYSVALAAVEMIWALSTIFFYVNLVRLYLRDQHWFHAHRIFPMWVLWICIVIGPIGCLVAILDALFYSWITQIDNTHWLAIVGGLTSVCIIIAVLGSMFASSEAAWEDLSK